MPKWQTARLKRTEDMTPTTRRFWLEVPEVEAVDFKPGQFITFDLPVAEKRLDRWRSYSIASAPEGNNELELCIVRLDGGKGTDYLFNEVSTGAELSFKGPAGMFTLPDSALENDLVFVCTGTGVAPFRSMLIDIRRRGRDHRGLHLIFGCRKQEDILYREEFEQLQRDLPGFRYSVALSREADLDPANFPFEVASGYVHQLYEKHYGQPAADRQFYLCGWSEMIDEARERLSKLGYGEQQVRYELYG
jgi:CDP-4-dehydro-6-deoxyglucose reductase